MAVSVASKDKRQREFKKISGSLLNSENGGMPGNGSAMPGGGGMPGNGSAMPGGGGMPNGGGPGNPLSGSSLNNTIEKSGETLRHSML